MMRFRNFDDILTSSIFDEREYTDRVLKSTRIEQMIYDELHKESILPELEQKCRTRFKGFSSLANDVFQSIYCIKIKFNDDSDMSAASRLIMYENILQNNMQKKGKAIRAAVRKATAAANEKAVNAAYQIIAWGDSDGSMRLNELNTSVLKKCAASEKLRYIAGFLGRYKEIMNSKRLAGYTYGRGEKYDIGLGNNLSKTLTSDLALLASPELLPLFARKYRNKSLKEYRRREPEYKGKGDVIVCLDESDSTLGENSAYGMAVAMVLYELCRMNGANFALVHFANKTKTDFFPKGEQVTGEQLMACAETFLSGGTNFDAALSGAIKAAEKMDKPDIVFITDGACHLSEEMQHCFKKFKTDTGARLTGILLDNFDLKKAMARGADFKDYIAPDSIEFKKDYIKIGDKYARTIFLKEYPSFLKDSMISELTDFSRSMMLSITIQPIPTDEAVKIVQKKLLAIETDITKWQQKQNENNNFSANIPYEMEQMRKEIKEFLDDLTTRDQRMMFVTVTLLHIADSLEQLDNDTETLMSIGRKHLCTFATLKYQQEDGMQTVLPYGTLNIKAMRTLTTESTAVLSPYKTQEIIDKGGLYYGINAISHNLLMCNRKLLLNGNGFILGVSGSGKSFAAKMEILMAALFSNDDIIIVDAEREYGSLVRNLGGEVITLSTSSENHINALEINSDIDMDENPVSIKSEFLISLFDQLLKSTDSRLGGGVGAKDKSIIDRCAIKVYGDFLGGKSEYMPTLVDFRNELLRQPEDEAQDLALSLEIFTTGSLDAFAHQSDVNVNNRIVAYDILELGEQMKSIGLLIMLDNIFNRVMANRKRGKYTRVYVDEAHLYFKNPYSADFLLKCWKRFRKYGGLLTGITQNISDCLLNETARGMLSNSEFLLLLNQAPSDRKDLSELLSISDTQMSYITNAGAGRGLIKVGGSIVPFINDFPTDTELYKLMSTKPGEN